MTRITYWKNGQHYWSGTGNEDDLTVRVCQFALERDKNCINTKQNSLIGQ